MSKTETKMERHLQRQRDTHRERQRQRKTQRDGAPETQREEEVVFEDLQPPPCPPLFQPLPWTLHLFGCYCQPLAPKRQKGPRGPLHVGAPHPHHVAPRQPTRWRFLPGVGRRGPQHPHTSRPRGSRHLRWVLNQTLFRLHPGLSQGQAPNHKEERNYRRGWRLK